MNTTTARPVRITTGTVGINFGTVAVVKCAKSGRRLEYVEVPYGLHSVAVERATALAVSRGWRVVA